MKQYAMFICLIYLFLTAQINAQTQMFPPKQDVDYPWVPRISAYEAYVKYKEGKAIIFHGGGNKYRERHIMGAFNLDIKDREGILQKFPKKGIEIFTYCY